MKEDFTPFKSFVNEILPERKPKQAQEEKALEDSNFPLAYAQDVQILMNREIHFGGSFNVMLEYYHGDGPGIDPEISKERIYQLAVMERDAKEDIAPFTLSGQDAEKVSRARETYEKLRALCEEAEEDEEKSPVPALVAALVLSEEEEPEEEMRAICEQGENAVQTLIDLLESEEFADPLFPGYGRVPSLAAQCLGKIASPESIRTLFQMLARAEFEMAEDLLTALRLTGEPARDFLLNIVQGQHLTKDSETAAFALLHFAEEELVAKACLAELLKAETRQVPELARYLALGCESLKDSEDRKLYRELRQDPSITSELAEEMDAITQSW